MSEQGVTRMNVSVPRELKAQMDAVAESVNWSAVAAQAFRDKLLSLQSQKVSKNMKDVIARLKAAAEAEANEDYQAGREAGERWAKNKAYPKQLRRLQKEMEGYRDWIEGQFESYTIKSKDGVCWHLYRVIEDVKLGDRTDPYDRNLFWEGVLGDRRGPEKMTGHAFAKGFVEGALDVWDAVKDKV